MDSMVTRIKQRNSANSKFIEIECNLLHSMHMIGLYVMRVHDVINSSMSIV